MISKNGDVSGVWKIIEPYSKAFGVRKSADHDWEIYYIEDEKLTDLSDLVYEASEGAIGDDFAYEIVARFFKYIVEEKVNTIEEIEEDLYMIAYGLSDLYNKDLLDWIEKSPNAVSYIDEILELGNFRKSFFELLHEAQKNHIINILNICVNFIKEKLEKHIE